MQLTSEEVESITNSASTLWAKMGEVNQTLLDNKIVNTTEDINSQFLGTLQWANASLLNNSDLIVGSSYVPYNSTKDIEMNFLR